MTANMDPEARSTRLERLSYKTSTYADIRPRELAADVKERKSRDSRARARARVPE